MPLAGHGLRPTTLRRRAGRPQLKRDPLGSRGEPTRCLPSLLTRTLFPNLTTMTQPTSITEAPTSNSPIVWAVLFLLTAGVLVGFGFYRMYTYDSLSETDKIVGGDAYNYIIIATRGLGFISAGIVAALAGASSLLIGILTRTAARDAAA